MEIRTLRYFMAIAREENMTRAAEILHVTQPTLSKQMQALENELGKKLFLRHSFSIELTEEGMLLRKRAEDLLSMADKILEEFGLKTEGSHIINGHVPVKLKDGEKPVKAGGKLFVIDGGLSKAYQSTTGIAGYTLIYNSHHLALAEHMPFDPKKDSTPKVSVVEKLKVRIMVADTDKGRELKEQIADLKELVAAYREGVIKERAE